MTRLYVRSSLPLKHVTHLTPLRETTTLYVTTAVPVTFTTTYETTATATQSVTTTETTKELVPTTIYSTTTSTVISSCMTLLLIESRRGGEC